jgi:hypothetical protein
MTRHHQLSGPALAPRLTPCRPLTQPYWPGLWHGSHIPDLSRTNQALEPCLGVQRPHERRAPGRQGAAPAWGRRGAMPRGAGTAPRLRSWPGEALAPRLLACRPGKSCGTTSPGVVRSGSPVAVFGALLTPISQRWKRDYACSFCRPRKNESKLLSSHWSPSSQPRRPRLWLSRTGCPGGPCSPWREHFALCRRNHSVAF